MAAPELSNELMPLIESGLGLNETDGEFEFETNLELARMRALRNQFKEMFSAGVERIGAERLERLAAIVKTFNKTHNDEHRRHCVLHVWNNL